MDDFKRFFLAQPPVTRSLVVGSVVLSSLVYVGLVSAYSVVFVPRLAWFAFPPQLWRSVTSLLLTGRGFAMLYEPYLLWQYSSGLETEASRFSPPGEYLMFLFFVSAVIQLLSVVIGGYRFLPCLSLALCYLYAVENPTRPVSLYVFPTKAKYVPYFYVAMTLLMAGPTAALQHGSGLLAGHLYHYLTSIWPRHGGGANLLQPYAKYFDFGIRSAGPRPPAAGAGGPGQAPAPVFGGQAPAFGARAQPAGLTGRFSGAGRRLG